MSTKAASKVVKQLAGSGTGQSLMDRMTQVKYSLAGSGLGKVVAKATTEEIGAPKKKHLDCNYYVEILMCAQIFLIVATSQMFLFLCLLVC